MIPRNLIDDVKARSDIVDVISSYVPLKRSGSSMIGLCPFHSERSPSFSVSPSTQLFYCFGCGAGGDVISFIMRQENLEYPDAVKLLADRAGITLPEDDGTEQQTGVGRRRVLDMNLCAARFFRDVLFDPQLGAPARAYIEERKLPSPIVRRFGLGYAPNSFHALYDYLKKNGFTDEEMTAGYCCLPGRNGRQPFDVFRNRLMIPIIDPAGNVIAFGGRVLDDSKPKYLNSGDTPAFKKSRSLFALNYAKTHCSERLILCEGYMDVIMLHAAGFENAVATLGTAITPDHARLMKKYSPNVVIAYDSDEAGQNATNKALRILAEAGIDATVIRMEGAKDPDEYIKKFGADKFAAVLAAGRPRFAFKLDAVLARNDITDADGKIRAVQEICVEIADAANAVEREIFTRRAAEVLDVRVDSIEAYVRSILEKRRKKARAELPGELYRLGTGSSDHVNPDYARRPYAAKIEEMLLGLLLMHPEYAALQADGSSLAADELPTDLGRRLFTAITDAEAGGGFDFALLSASFTQDEVSRAAGLRRQREALNQNGEDVYLESLRALRRENDKERSREENDFQYEIRRKRQQLADGKPSGAPKT